MSETDWDGYGTGNYEKCANCMVHSGYEPTAVTDTVSNPWKAMMVRLRCIRIDGPMAPEIPLENQRPAEFIFEKLSVDMERRLDLAESDEAEEREPQASDAA